ncbi:unnamed protein product, partial [Nesidiocoris tenuis]
MSKKWCWRWGGKRHQRCHSLCQDPEPLPYSTQECQFVNHSWRKSVPFVNFI